MSMGILKTPASTPMEAHGPGSPGGSRDEIGPDETETLHALAREDAEARVRRAAVTRVDAAEFLLKWREQTRTTTFAQKPFAVSQGWRLSRRPRTRAGCCTTTRRARQDEELMLVARDSSNPHVRGAVVDLLSDSKALSAVSRQGRDSATRLRALERLQDADEVLNVALKAEHTDTAVAALERLTDVSALTESPSGPATRLPGVAPGQSCV